jgi:polysaccharide pyruvyl transferase WcaK-like protein
VNLAAVADGYVLGGTVHYEKLMSSLDRLSALGVEIRFFAMEPRDAAMLLEIVPARLKFALDGMPTTLLALYKLLKSSTMVISERLHGAIIAANLGTPWLLIGYKPKCYDFAESIGADDTVVEIDVVGSREFDDTVASQLAANGLPASVVERIESLRYRFYLAHQGLFGD